MDKFEKNSSFEQTSDKINSYIDSLDISNLKSLSQIEKEINDIILLQKENQDILWVPWKLHHEQNQEVLKNDLYWKLNNVLSLLSLRKNILSEELDKFSSYSTWWSIGAWYLWFMLSDYEKWKFPDVIFWASAGSLFPSLFLLWKKAHELNPEKTWNWIDWLLRFLPKNLEGKDMFFNWSELISWFKNSATTLINIINEKLPNNEKLPSIDKISIWDLSPNFRIIASRKKKNWEFQEVIFWEKDNLLNSVVSSSNPEIKLLWLFNSSVLTKTDNIFLNNEWFDGFHTNENPLEYWKLLWINNKREHLSFLFQNKNIGEQFLFKNNQRIVPDMNWFMIWFSDNNYKIKDQSWNWWEDEMKMKLIMSYYRGLNLSNFWYFLKDVFKNIKSEKLKLLIYNNFKESFYPLKVWDIGWIEKNIEMFNSIDFLTPEDKKQIIIKLFYFRDIMGYWYTINNKLLINKYLSYKLDDSWKAAKNELENEPGTKNLGDILTYISTDINLSHIDKDDFLKIIQRYMSLDDFKNIITNNVIYNTDIKNLVENWKSNTLMANDICFYIFFKLEWHFNLFWLNFDEIKKVLFNYNQLTNSNNIPSNYLINIIDISCKFWLKEKEFLLKYILENIRLSPHDINFLNQVLDSLFWTYRNLKASIYPKFYNKHFDLPGWVYYFWWNTIIPKPSFFMKKWKKEYKIDFNEDNTYELYDVTWFEYNESIKWKFLKKGNISFDEKNKKYDLKDIF